MNKQAEIKKIKEAKKNGEIYISPLVMGDNALIIEALLKKGLVGKGVVINKENK